MDTSIGIKLSATGAQQVKTDLLSVSNGVDLLGNAAQRVSTNAAAMVASLGAGLVAGLGASAFASIIKGSVDSAAALHDLSIQTGATVESLSALGSIGKYTDTSAQQIGEAMNKLARNMAGATEESKGTGKALQAIGLDFAKFKDLAPEEQMQTAAKALGQFADGSGKSAAAMALFGKEGAKMLPFLKDLGVAGELTAKVTADQAAAADDFADNLTRLQSSGDAWKKELAMGMIPALNLGLQAFVDVTNGAGGLRDEVRNLSKDGSINNWTKSAITGVTYVIDVFSGLKAVIKSLGSYWGALAATAVQTLGTVGDAVAKAMKGDFKGAVSDVMGIGGKVKEVWSGLGDDLADIWGEQTLGSKIRARMKDIDALGGAAEKAKPKLNFTNVLDSDGKADNSAAKEALSQQISYYEELQAVAVQSLQREQESLASAHSAGLLSDAKYYAAKRDLAANTNIDQQALIELEIESVQASTVASKDKVAAINRYNVELTKLKEQQLSIVQKYSDEIDAAEAKQAIATIKAYADQVEGAQQAAVALNAQAQAQLDHNATIGLGVQALADLEAAKLQEQATSKDRLATLADEIDWSGQLGDAYRAQAKALRELASAKTLGAAKQVVADLAKEQANEALRMADQVGQGLANSLMQGGKSAWEYIKGLFRTQLVMRVGGVLTSAIVGATSPGLAAANTVNAATGAGNLMGAGAGLYNSFATSSVGGSLGLSVPYVDVLGTGAAEAGIMTSAGSSLGAALPWIGGGLAVLSLLKSLDDSGTYHTGGLGSYSAAGGTAVGDAVKGQGLGFDLAAKDYTASSQQAAAALAQSVVGMLDSTANTFGQQAGYYAATAFADDTSKDGAWGALMLKLGDKVLIDWQQGTDKWPGREFADGEAGAKEYAAAIAVAVRDQLITQVPDWADATLQALGDAPTLEQLGVVVTQINAAAAAMAGMGQASAAFAGLSETATAALIKALGGAEASSASLGSYYTNFYSESERAAIATAQLTDQLAALGVAMPTGRDAYKALVDAAVAAGDATLAAQLISLGSAFAQLVPAAADATTAAQAAAQAATTASTSALKTAIDREKQTWQTAVDAAAQLRDEVQGVFATLSDGITALRADGLGVQGAAAQAQQYISQALAAAMGTGALPDGTALADAISAAQAGISGGQYGSETDRQYAALVLAGQLETLQGVAGDQLTEAERQYRAAQTQIEQLDKTLEYWQQQVDISQGNLAATLSVADAVIALQEALKPGSTGAAKDAAATARQAIISPTGDSMDAYRSSLAGVADYDAANWVNVGGRYVNVSSQTMASPEDYYAARLQQAYWSPEADMASTFAQLTQSSFAGSADALLALAKAAGLDQSILDSYKQEFVQPVAVVQRAAYTPYVAPAAAPTTAQIEGLVQSFTAEIATLKAAIEAGNANTAATAQTLAAVTNGNALVTEPVPNF